MVRLAAVLVAIAIAGAALGATQGNAAAKKGPGVLSQVTTVPAHSSKTAAVICDSREGISGGGTIGGGYITATMPVLDGTGAVVGWSVTFDNPTSSPIAARAVAVCS